MLAALAHNWGWMLVRATISILFGVLIVAWPELLPSRLALLFAGYALVDGIVSLIVAMGTAGAQGFGILLFEGFMRVGVGTFAFLWPDQATLALKTVITIWALLSAVAAIAVAGALHRQIAGEWPLPLAGVVSAIAAVSLIGGFAPSDLAWVLGPYSALFGFTLLVLALRLRELAQEIPAPPL